jgi:hypothetical protein
LKLPHHRRNPRPRTDTIALKVSTGIALTAVLLAACVWTACNETDISAASREPAPPPRLKGTTVDLQVSIQTSLPTQYESNVLLEDGDPVPLVLEYRALRVAGYEVRVRWWCDQGRVEREEGVLRNRFYPPTRSGISTINAEVSFHPKQKGRTLKIAAFNERASLKVLSPLDGHFLRNGEIDGFHVGEYLDPNSPETAKKFDLTDSWARIYPNRFLAPTSFYLVDDSTRDFQIARHQRLGDHALHYPWFSLGKRQYIALDTGLVRKIEDLIDELNRAGLPGDRIRFIYAFRPPAYNSSRILRDAGESLKAPFSLHQYGKAVDLILDADGDDRIDDLNKDGQITVRDAAALAHYVNLLDRRYRDQGLPLYGGAGIYDHHDFWERPAQTPYVHMDVRGFLDQNGHLIRWPAEWPDTGTRIEWGKM